MKQARAGGGGGVKPVQKKIKSHNISINFHQKFIIFTTQTPDFFSHPAHVARMLCQQTLLIHPPLTRIHIVSDKVRHIEEDDYQLITAINDVGFNVIWIGRTKCPFTTEDFR
jgi:hypothetical protein